MLLADWCRLSSRANHRIPRVQVETAIEAKFQTYDAVLQPKKRMEQRSFTEFEQGFAEKLAPLMRRSVLVEFQTNKAG